MRNEYTAMCVSCPGIEQETNQVMKMKIGILALHVFVSVGFQEVTTTSCPCPLHLEYEHGNGVSIQATDSRHRYPKDVAPSGIIFIRRLSSLHQRVGV